MSKPQEAPKDFQPDALIHPTTILTGEHLISIGSKVIIQPRTRLDSTNGPIKIGANTIIAERCSIGPGSSVSQNDAAIGIGEGVVVETGAVIAAAKVGDFTTIAVQARLGSGARIGANCRIGQGVTVREGDVIPDNTVVWGDHWDQRRTEHENGGVSGGVGRDGVVKGLGDGLRAIWSNK